MGVDAGEGVCESVTGAVGVSVASADVVAAVVSVTGIVVVVAVAVVIGGDCKRTVCGCAGGDGSKSCCSSSTASHRSERTLLMSTQRRCLLKLYKNRSICYKYFCRHKLVFYILIYVKIGRR